MQIPDLRIVQLVLLIRNEAVIGGDLLIDVDDLGIQQLDLLIDDILLCDDVRDLVLVFLILTLNLLDLLADLFLFLFQLVDLIADGGGGRRVGLDGN